MSYVLFLSDFQLFTGHYCPSGTSDPVDCPRGTYNPSEQGSNMTDCLACTPGYYCLEAGKANVTDECDAGYYCHGGAEEQNPTGKLMLNMIFTIILYSVPLSINLLWSV